MTALSKVLIFGNNSKNILTKLPIKQSICLKSTNSSQLINKQIKINTLIFNQIRHSGHGRQMNIRPGVFYTKKFWDLIHIYTSIAVIPLGLFILYKNIFIGPAELVEIPEDYEPRYWEYTKHPVKRSLQKNFFQAPEKSYELSLSNIYDDQCDYKMKRLEKKVRLLMKEREDYKGWYYSPETSATSDIANDYSEKRKLVGHYDVNSKR